MHPASHACANETLCSDWPQGFNIRAEYAEQQEMLQDTPLHAGAGERQYNHEELDAL
ncbi:hypothetical protein GCM10011352_28690 [Marinobacterium zhoushanense]|uniref:Uncharacterized protein n=1 Tax=Marinobacterium zhoushanense TaxID=1679163 RepID=A0ABQ1KLF0_9GAMM|nr:hypothetical protein [Marinobacterium zhoushanense]GGC00797.1 hypothetical protein GCM10011352_28690 [Marinobacterium zhoushanense]